MRIGILGGTFDPIHMAHLIIAEESRIRVPLQKVVFIPTGKPWLKGGRQITAGSLRMEMVRLAVADNPAFDSSSIEIDRPGLTYSVDTLEELVRQWGPDVEINFIIGVDSLLSLPRWKDPDRFLDRCTLTAVTRPGYSPDALEEIKRQYPVLERKLGFVEGPPIGISGTEIRRRVSSGLSVRYLVPPGVERFITERGLYKDVAE